MSRRERLARAGLVFAVVAPLAYLAQRLFERGQGGVGDPLAIVREAHVAFYWRASIAAWWGGVAAALASSIPRLPPMPRALRRALPPLGALLLLTLAFLWP
jgi:hypothetical protein